MWANSFETVRTLSDRAARLSADIITVSSVTACTLRGSRCSTTSGARTSLTIAFSKLLVVIGSDPRGGTHDLCFVVMSCGMALISATRSIRSSTTAIPSSLFVWLYSGIRALVLRCAARRGGGEEHLCFGLFKCCALFASFLGSYFSSLFRFRLPTLCGGGAWCFTCEKQKWSTVRL